MSMNFLKRAAVSTMRPGHPDNPDTVEWIVSNCDADALLEIIREELSHDGTSSRERPGLRAFEQELIALWAATPRKHRRAKFAHVWAAVERYAMSIKNPKTYDSDWAAAPSSDILAMTVANSAGSTASLRACSNMWMAHALRYQVISQTASEELERVSKHKNFKRAAHAAALLIAGAADASMRDSGSRRLADLLVKAGVKEPGLRSHRRMYDLVSTSGSSAFCDSHKELYKEAARDVESAAARRPDFPDSLMTGGYEWPNSPPTELVWVLSVLLGKSRPSIYGDARTVLTAHLPPSWAMYADFSSTWDSWPVQPMPIIAAADEWDLEWDRLSAQNYLTAMTRALADDSPVSTVRTCDDVFALNAESHVLAAAHTAGKDSADPQVADLLVRIGRLASMTTNPMDPKVIKYLRKDPDWGRPRATHREPRVPATARIAGYPCVPTSGTDPAPMIETFGSGRPKDDSSEHVLNCAAECAQLSDDELLSRIDARDLVFLLKGGSPARASLTAATRTANAVSRLLGHDDAAAAESAGAIDDLTAKLSEIKDDLCNERVSIADAVGRLYADQPSKT